MSRRTCCSLPLLASGFSHAALPTSAGTSNALQVTIPYMDRLAPHRTYADQLLAIALDLASDRYGPAKVVQQARDTVIRRQLLELERDGGISVAIALPSAEWLDMALPVRVPIMRGLSSFRLFFGLRSKQALYDSVRSIEDLKALRIGQGPGWSTAPLLEANGFKITYGGTYNTLIPMLAAERYPLLMRAAFEVGPELKANTASHPELMLVEPFALFSYLPMYFFVSRRQPQLAERIEYGLKRAHASGALDKLFQATFGDALRLLRRLNPRYFTIPNPSLEARSFERDRPYLLPEVIALEERRLRQARAK